jgi:hypothetical protein
LNYFELNQAIGLQISSPELGGRAMVQKTKIWETNTMSKGVMKNCNRPLKKMTLALLGLLVLFEVAPARAAVGAAGNGLAQAGSFRENIDTLTVDEVVGALNELGGDAAVGLSNVVKTVFKNSGQPSALIVGDEVQGSLIVGYRKGNGVLVFHGNKLADSPKIKWSAPSVGINVGASVNKVAILVYGAENMEQLKQQFVSVEGSYHLIGGAAVSYMTNPMREAQDKKLTLAYISVGLGLDAGVAVESLRFK